MGCRRCAAGEVLEEIKWLEEIKKRVA